MIGIIRSKHGIKFIEHQGYPVGMKDETSLPDGLQVDFETDDLGRAVMVRRASLEHEFVAAFKDELCIFLNVDPSQPLFKVSQQRIEILYRQAVEAGFYEKLVAILVDTAKRFSGQVERR